LRPGGKKEIKKATDKFWSHKRLFQEFGRPNAGCVFKNPGVTSRSRQPLLSAGKLIDLCGLKGLSRGGAVISRRHANFILNNGNARAKDVLDLMRIIQQKVKRHFNLQLSPEIKIIGDK
jgi:UDP-N-acetylmuramate dehydrogenase